MGRLGAGAWTICWQAVQLNFGRTWRITLNRDGTYSKTSATSSPKARRAPPQAGQSQGASCTIVSRGNLLRQRTARRSSSFSVTDSGLKDRCATLRRTRLEFLETQFKLSNRLIELFGGAPKLHAL